MQYKRNSRGEYPTLFTFAPARGANPRSFTTAANLQGRNMQHVQNSYVSVYELGRKWSQEDSTTAEQADAIE